MPDCMKKMSTESTIVKGSLAVSESGAISDEIDLEMEEDEPEETFVDTSDEADVEDEDEEEELRKFAEEKRRQLLLESHHHIHHHKHLQNSVLQKSTKKTEKKLSFSVASLLAKDSDDKDDKDSDDSSTASTAERNSLR